MNQSNWKMVFNATSHASAEILLNRCLKKLDHSHNQYSVDKYHKGGYVATLTIEHKETLQWPEFVVEVIALGQRLGGGWVIMGDIADDADAVLSTNTGGRVNVSGLEWAQWSILNSSRQDR